MFVCLSILDAKLGNYVKTQDIESENLFIDMKILFVKYLCFFQVKLHFKIQAIQNLGTALITMGAGSIVDEYGKYEEKELV